MEIQENINIDRIKWIIKEIVRLNFINKKPLSDEQISLGKEIGIISFAMFSKRKLENKTFTVCNNVLLRKAKISEDDDGVKAEDLLNVEIFLKDNSEAFQELVAQYFISKTPKDYKTDNQLFYLNISSKYTSQKEDVFFINKRGNFIVYIDELTNIRLKDYICEYYGDLGEDLINEIDKLKNNRMATHEELQTRLTSAFDELYDISAAEYRLLKGAITFFDFLGWKGLWLGNDGNPLKDISDLIEDFNEKLKLFTNQLFKYSNNMEFSKLLSISDTIAIFTPKLPSITEKQLLELHSTMARYILEQSILKKYPIRGAITYGEYNFKNNVMIGPGIDECASWHEKCDWIGAHFTPTAQFILNDQNFRF